MWKVGSFSYYFTISLYHCENSEVGIQTVTLKQLYLAMSHCAGASLSIVKRLENIEVPETYSGEFEVELSREDAEGTWYFNDKEITPSSKYVTSSRRGRHALSIKDVKKEDQGKYTFKIADMQTSASLKMKREL